MRTHTRPPRLRTKAGLHLFLGQTLRDTRVGHANLVDGLALALAQAELELSHQVLQSVRGRVHQFELQGGQR